MPSTVTVTHATGSTSNTTPAHKQSVVWLTLVLGCSFVHCIYIALQHLQGLAESACMALRVCHMHTDSDPHLGLIIQGGGVLAGLCIALLPVLIHCRDVECSKATSCFTGGNVIVMQVDRHPFGAV